MLRSFLLKGGIFLAFEQYLQRGRQKLRCGYTTGACAALAAKAAAKMLLTQQMAQEETLVLPKGLAVTVPIEEAAFSPSFASCAVRKDGGTTATPPMAFSSMPESPPVPTPVWKSTEAKGVGRVTRPGLDQPVGAAAINSTPRRMIREEVEAVCRSLDYQGGLSVVISTPGGEAVAQKTFNPVLGIEGGISILGTSGVVEPQSLQALLDTIQVELKMHAAAGCKEVIFTPGNYGEDFLKAHPPVREIPVVKISNFVGDSLDFAVEMGFTQVYLVGHLGKFVKLAAGVMNTPFPLCRRSAGGLCRPCGDGWGQPELHLPADGSPHRRPVPRHFGRRRPSGAGSRFHFQTDSLPHPPPGRWVQVEAVVFSNQSGALAYSEEAGRLFRL